MTPALPKIVLKKPHAGRVRLWHPWIYRSQVKEPGSFPPPGSLVDVYSSSNRFIGTGYFNPKSEISVRILTREKEPIDKNFFKHQIEKAARFRQKVVSQTNAFRLISSEADGLPGLIVDRYAEILVVQFLTAGMEGLRPLVLDALGEVLPEARGIYERSDSSSRRIEGLEEKTGWIRQDCGSDILVSERDVNYRVLFEKGQKAGLYLDQRENRLLLRDLGLKGEVLDAFCYTGGFGLHLASAGCRVLGIDSQKEAIDQAERNRELNHIPRENLDFRVANVFDELRTFEKENRKFDLVILDPPSFVKRKQELQGAITGYKEIILRGMKLLNEGRWLAVFSCSYHVDENLLLQIAMSAAADVRKDMTILRFMKQSSDHPIKPLIPETYYLKGFLLEVSSL